MPFQYKPRSQESFQKREAQQIQAADSMFDRAVIEFRPHDGENNIRILPPGWNQPDHYGVPLFVHYGVGVDRTAFLSLTRHLGKRDPIAEVHTVAMRNNDEKRAKESRVSERVAFFLIDRANPDKGPQLWNAPKASIDAAIRSVCFDAKTNEPLYPDDPENGYDIFFHKSGKGLKTSYSKVELARRPSPLHADPVTKKQWLDFVLANPIPSMLKFYSYERIAAVMNGTALSHEMQEVAPAAPVAQPQPQTETQPQPPTANEAYAHVGY